MGAIASQIISLTIKSTVYSDADQRKHQSSVSLTFARGIHQLGEFPAQMASNAPSWLSIGLPLVYILLFTMFLS